MKSSARWVIASVILLCDIKTGYAKVAQQIRIKLFIADTTKRKRNGSDCFLILQLRNGSWKRNRCCFCTYNTFNCISRTNWKHFLRIDPRFNSKSKKPGNQCQQSTSSNPICWCQERVTNQHKPSFYIRQKLYNKLLAHGKTENANSNIFRMEIINA